MLSRRIASNISIPYILLYPIVSIQFRAQKDQRRFNRHNKLPRDTSLLL